MGFLLTGGEKREVCLVLTNYELFTKVREQLKDYFALKNVSSVEKAVDTIRQQNVFCLIAEADEKTGYSPLQLSIITQQFPILPKIAIVDGTNFELFYSCFKIRIKEIVSITKLDKLHENILQALNRKQQKINWSELGIELEKCSHLVKKAVVLIEENYNRDLYFLQDVAKILNVSYETLSRMFASECSVYLSKLINYVKLYHAVILIKNKDLKLVEIAMLTGFSDYLHFNKCFKRFINVPPKEFREKDLSVDFRKLFHARVKINREMS